VPTARSNAATTNNILFIATLLWREVLSNKAFADQHCITLFEPKYAGVQGLTIISKQNVGE
jgi:hypothetical protein